MSYDRPSMHKTASMAKTELGGCLPLHLPGTVIPGKFCTGNLVEFRKTEEGNELLGFFSFTAVPDDDITVRLQINPVREAFAGEPLIAVCESASIDAPVGWRHSCTLPRVRGGSGQLVVFTRTAGGIEDQYADSLSGVRILFRRHGLKWFMVVEAVEPHAFEPAEITPSTPLAPRPAPKPSNEAPETYADRVAPMLFDYLAKLVKRNSSDSKAVCELVSVMYETGMLDASVDEDASEGAADSGPGSDGGGSEEPADLGPRVDALDDPGVLDVASEDTTAASDLSQCILPDMGSWDAALPPPTADESIARPAPLPGLPPALSYADLDIPLPEPPRVPEGTRAPEPTPVAARSREFFPDEHTLFELTEEEQRIVDAGRQHYSIIAEPGDDFPDRPLPLCAPDVRTPAHC